jgi:hypothetical protein
LALSQPPSRCRAASLTSSHAAGDTTAANKTAIARSSKASERAANTIS